MTRIADTVETPRAASKHPITVEDLWAFARVGAPQAGAAGGGVVVSVTQPDLEANTSRTRLWLLPDRGAARPLTTDELNSREPALSPDGRRVAFVRAKPGEPGQLHVLPLDGGEAQKLTDLPLGCADPRWLPDGQRVVILVPLFKDAPTPEGTRELAAGREKDPVKAHVTEDRLYRYWDRWLTGGDVPHLFVCDTRDGSLRDLTPESTRWFELMDPLGQYDISPDGTEIAFSADASGPPHTQTNWDIFTVPVDGGPVRNLTAHNPLDDWRPRYSRDGRFILYGMQVKPGFYADRVRLVLYERATGAHTVITEEWDRSAAGWEWSRESGEILLHAEDRGRTAIYAMKPERGIPREVCRGGNIGGISPAPGGRVYFSLDDLDNPAEVAVCQEDGSGFQRVSRFNADALAAIGFGEVSEMEFEGADGGRVQMVVVRPPGFDEKKKWPLVHLIHGGPHGLFGASFTYRWNAHMFAAQGYVVAMVNFHGSTSWGQQFAECIQGSWGDRPFRDIMAATDLLARQPWIDETRMAATGGSYGGYMAAWIAGHTDRFACIVNHAGVSDLMSQWGSDVSEGRDVSMGGTPWDGLDAMERWSPVRYAKNFKTPMLVIHGEKDYRVPVGQGLEIYAIYKAMGLPARLVYFPDENHWVLKPQNSRLWYAEFLGWLERWLKR